jgi:multicomponent Na+:H+ antiporter subunit D
MILTPAAILILGAVAVYAATPAVRRVLVVLLPLLALAAIWLQPTNAAQVLHIAGIDLLTYHVHPFSRLFATAFALVALMGGVFAMNIASRTELTAATVYAGGALGVAFAGDLIAMFVFIEIMALASTVIIWCGGRPRSGAAGLRYAYMHLFGGVLLLAGITAHIVSGASTAMAPMIVSWGNITGAEPMGLPQLAAWLMLAGVLLNAAAPPFSAWLADSYPESSPSGMVFLSAFTTKTAVFILLTLFAGNRVLVPIGLIMVFYGIFMAMLENDMRRILAYSIVNQVGLMVVAVGIGTELAQYGAAAHAFCHIIYKALLIMSAGSVLVMTGKSKCTELGGLYRSMPLTTLCGIVGAISISAFPLTSGFVSKSLISSAAAEQHLAVTWFLLAAASAGVFLHAGIKFPWFVFFQKDSDLRPSDPPKAMRIAMLLAVVGCILPGIAPSLFYKLLPGAVGYMPYTGAHVVSQLQLLLFSALAFFLLLPLMKRTNTISLDMDWLYRVLLLKLLRATETAWNNIVAALQMVVMALWHYLQSAAYALAAPRRVLAGNWGVGFSAFLLAVMLLAFLLVYLVQHQN